MADTAAARRARTAAARRRRLDVAQLERDAVQAARLLLGELTTSHLALILDGNSRAGVDTPRYLPVEAYVPAGRQAAFLLLAFGRRIVDAEAGR